MGNLVHNITMVIIIPAVKIIKRVPYWRHQKIIIHYFAF